MSWSFSRVMVAAYSLANFSDGKSSPPSNSTTTQGASSWRDKMTDALDHFRSGMTCLHLTGSRGADWWIAYLADFHASASAQPETIPSKEGSQDSTTPKADSCANNSESYEKLNPPIADLRTTPTSQNADSLLFSLHLPRWGSMRHGILYQRTHLVLPTNVNASGLRLPTPTAHNAKEGNYPAERTRNTLSLGAVFGGKVNPQYVEWMMGFPIGWTDLSDSGMHKFQSWQLAHGISSSPEPKLAVLKRKTL